MSNERLDALAAAGVSIWLDDLSRERLRSGNLQSLITDSARGRGDHQPDDLRRRAGQRRGLRRSRSASSRSAAPRSTTRSARSPWPTCVHACDVFRGTWEATNGVDGRVSLEVDPRLAHDTAGTVAQALDLWKAVDRPNLLVKIPATEAGPAGDHPGAVRGRLGERHADLLGGALPAGHGRLPGRAGAGRGERPPAGRDRLGGQLLRLPGGHRDRQAAGEDRHRRGAGAARAGRHRQLAAGLRGVPGGVLRRALGRAGRPRAPRRSGRCGRRPG